VTKVGLVIISIATAKHDVLASFATHYSNQLQHVFWPQQKPLNYGETSNLSEALVSKMFNPFSA